LVDIKGSTLLVSAGIADQYTTSELDRARIAMGRDPFMPDKFQDFRKPKVHIYLNDLGEDLFRFGVKRDN
jgi:hypothetical protein